MLWTKWSPNCLKLAELWAEAADGPKWRKDITRLRDALDPPIPPQEEALFDIWPVTHSHSPQNVRQSQNEQRPRGVTAWRVAG